MQTRTQQASQDYVQCCERSSITNYSMSVCFPTYLLVKFSVKYSFREQYTSKILYIHNIYSISRVKETRSVPERMNLHQGDAVTQMKSDASAALVCT